MDEDAPITPITGPNIDAEGRLTYMGEDGRRYVVMDGDERDETSSAAVMEALRSAGPLFEEIETLCQGWVDEVSDAALTRAEAIALLLATLETALFELVRDRIAAAACCAPVRHVYPNIDVPSVTLCCLVCVGWAPQMCPA